MPAVITHCLFGKDVHERLHETIGDAIDARDAFLLGCQGPDVLFFSNVDPSLFQAWNMGTKMHRANPDALLKAFVDSANSLVDDVRPIGQAYVRGMLCHYLLDSRMHPLIYAQQYALCDAGVEGLDRSASHEVHAEIESELDVLALSSKTGKTIQTFDPSKEALTGEDTTLRIISCIYRRVAEQVFGTTIPTSAFERSTKTYRTTLKALRSPKGTKRFLLGHAERIFRNHSLLQAMSHRACLLETSPFDNRSHMPWTNPWTKEVRTESFWDLYDGTLALATLLVPGFTDASEDAIARITDGLDFDGAPTRAAIVGVIDL